MVGAAVSVPGCGWWDSGDDDRPSVPARAERSAERLPSPQREAAQALVALEKAARARDGARLCESVYDFSSGEPPTGCRERIMRLFPTENGFALEIRRVRFRSQSNAVGEGSTVTIDRAGRAERFPRTRYELVRRDGAWRVHFID